MSDSIRWGILGTGTIAHAFAKGLRDAPGAELVAVGSRSQESADRFGDEFGIPRRHATYAALAQDQDVDV
ncbi:MAG: Gfo/Idh/MocA family oxidoreductase, partial [Planctomycetota bacterium]